MPSPHQTPLIEAVVAAGADLQVRYLSHVIDQRIALGWAEHTPKEYERFVGPQNSLFQDLPDWRDRVHIVPGCGSATLRALVGSLCRNDAQWIHWSERSRRGWRSVVGYLLKRHYAHLINSYALGACYIGDHARQDFLRWGVRENRLAFLPYSVSAPPHNALEDQICAEFKGRRRAFLFVGSLCSQKGVGTLLTAFQRLARRSPQWALVLCGRDCTEGRYHAFVDDRGLRSRVLFRGAVPTHEIYNVMKAADVLILPSLDDGWGACLSEGAAAGLALIGSDHCGATEHMIRPGFNGFHVTAGCVGALEHAMAAYIATPTLAAEHGASSRYIFRDYTPDRNAQRLLAAIRSWRAHCPGADSDPGLPC
jgi:glycosyltransferase involved in cell wall biosynthesis